MKTILIFLLLQLTIANPATASVTSHSTTFYTSVVEHTESDKSVPPNFLPMLAQTSIDGPIENFMSFLFKILLLVALIMVLWAGYLIHDGKVREGTFALCGAFLLALSSVVVHQLFNIAGH